MGIEVNVEEAAASTTDIKTFSRSSSPSPSPDHEEESRISQKQLLRKLDLHFLPIITIYLLLSYIDRASVGNAKIAGLYTDLHLKDEEYNISIAIFYLIYAISQLPSNIMLKKLRPGIYLPGLVFLWGTVTTLHGIVHNFTGLVLARVALGVLEAGIYPGCFYLMTVWYPRDRVVSRFTIFVSSVFLSGAIGGFLARALLCLDGVGGLEGWRWIFIGEGLATVFIAVATCFLLPDSPETARFLTTDEKAALAALLAADYKQETTQFSWREIGAAFHDWKVWSGGAINFCLGMVSFAISIFLPSIIYGFGYSATHSQLLTVPPFLAAAILVAGAGFAADKYKTRSIPILVFLPVGVTGLVMLITLQSSMLAARYCGVVLMTLGVSVGSALNLSWIAGNIRGQSKRAAAISIQGGVGLFAGIPMPFIFQEKDRPEYRTALGILLGFISAAFVLCTVQVWFLRKENQKLDREQDQGIRNVF